MSNPDSDGFSLREQSGDRVVNDETRRALRRRGRQGGMILTGAFVAIVIFAVSGFVAVLSVPWQFAVVVTVSAALVAPVAVPYAMLRVVGLSHLDVLYVGKQAYREAIAEITALSGTRQADVFTESAMTANENTENSPSEMIDADENSNESAENGSLTPDGDKNESESTTNAEETEDSIADEAADTATESETESQ